ncbi:hypothetical protein FC699_06490 [Bacillus wiedmannii]|uniref:Uncharacterized protein n=1 Tax=Bacillus wiedmannii TaxID=1890302 RepID=A0A4U2MYV6_9BACI|nr:hypothetical protein DN389_22935 [Bacillus sp. AY3-1]TKH16897.1 hypothetical protein FC694_11295 [Bacillus wiedmannii]TKI97842.1 hypothetical protein FC699_06490 [Bacillus wiedmannii]
MFRDIDHIFTRYLPGSKTPPKNSTKVKKLGARSTARKCPIKVSLYKEEIDDDGKENFSS